MDKQLTLPPAPLQLRPGPSTSGRLEVYDELRARWVTMTPEEEVRQRFTAWLIGSRGYNRYRMANEMTITLNGMSRRCDTVVFDPSGQRPLAIVEYKAPSVKITAKVFAQAARYNTVLATPLLIVSNGLTHFCALIEADGRPRFLKEIPTYDSLIRLLNSCE